ncbi:peptide ABC transporter substrate-binding protein [Meiothermus sp.]|uniref:ABC transporter substrate-binding protein n=1 Tax=Meiothermus sp. TaxID=1955249 RepID=UPI0021DBFA2E|nr:peptide ABC transporter substrate-binding protein [Meiothermus sp.]GIW34960.1 MAG: DNA-binding protein [Meiothermus sp.]
MDKVNRFLIFLLIVLSLGRAQQLVLAIPAEEGFLTPFTYVTGYPGYNLLSLVYDTLMIPDINGLPKPWLAEQVRVTNAGRDWTIRLKNAQWHDGKPLTSDDVKFTYEYYRRYPVVSRFTSAVRSISQIRTPDARTVQISLPRPEGNFELSTLADVPILPKHIWENITDPKAHRDSIGSGPFKLVEIRPGQSYRFEANPSYFGGTVAPKSLVVVIIREATATFQALRAGQIAASSRELLPELISQFDNDPSFRLLRGALFTSNLLQFNTTVAPFNQPAFRQIIAGLVDPKAVVDTVLLGQATVGSPGFLHPQSPLYSPEAGQYPRLSLPQAEQRLEQLGYRRGSDGVRVGKNGQRLEFELLAPANNPIRLRAAELIAQQVRPAGIVFQVRALEPNTLTDRVWPEFDVSKGRNYSLAMFGWSAPVINQANLRGMFHSKPALGNLNIGGYANATVDSLTERLNTTVDLAERKLLAARVQSLVARDLPFLTLWYPDATYAVRPSVYDGWKFQRGQGILNKFSFLP